MQSGAIPNASIKASSIWHDPSGHEPWRARLHNQPKLPYNTGVDVAAWVAGNDTLGEYLQVDLGEVMYVTAVATQGRPYLTSESQRVKKYRLAYRLSGNPWKAYREYNAVKELGSNRSYVSHTSSTSSTSAIRAQAKADAAAALKKAEMHTKKVQIENESRKKLEEQGKKLREEQETLAKMKRDEEIRLQSLVLDEEVAIAQARLTAIEDECGYKDENTGSEGPNLPEIDSKQRVIDYLSAQPHHEAREAIQVPPSNHKISELLVSNGAQINQPTTGKTTVESYIQFMARREVISNKVEKFDDQPENFRTWKATFKSMIRDINITASEELSLLAEYTTRESKKLVQRLRNAYIENPDEGVKETWRKLCERFGSDAVITNVHLNKLNVFPKIGGKDNKKLQELGDLLLELECAKNGGGFKGLGILDEPTYLRPIVEKLPDDLQRRWQRHAYRYKVNNTVDYPPFAVLSEFVQDIAQERNDPFLTLETADEETVRPTRRQQAKLPHHKTRSYDH
ncbi:hypothetical protein QZH41_004966 [Actinostola sp. cb2023]|nr:hypothetical protein QZH41_004966 [Actinostola sp. cb2023]